MIGCSVVSGRKTSTKIPLRGSIGSRLIVEAVEMVVGLSHRLRDKIAHFDGIG